MLPNKVRVPAWLGAKTGGGAVMTPPAFTLPKDVPAWLGGAQTGTRRRHRTEVTYQPIDHRILPPVKPTIMAGAGGGTTPMNTRPAAYGGSYAGGAALNGTPAWVRAPSLNAVRGERHRHGQR